MVDAGCIRSRGDVVVSRWYSIFLVIILLSGLFRDGITIALFKINQAYIASTLCVNRDKPMTMCGGSCYLKKKLEQNHKQDKPYPGGKTKEDRPLEFYSRAVPFVRAEIDSRNTERYQVYDEIPSSHEFVTGIFHPPKR